MIHYNVLRKNYKTFIENKNVIINLQKQLKFNQEINIKQIKIIKRQRQKRLMIENRSRKIIKKLLKTSQQLKNCQKKHVS